MIEARNINVGYENRIVIEDLSLKINEGEIVSIIGPNGSGKSTLLKSLSKILKRKGGEVLIVDKSIDLMKNNDVAKVLSMVSQQNTSPTDITVKELVYYGRIPHKKWFELRTKEDEEIVEWSLKQTGVLQYADRKLVNLSGGEIQRVWLAMAIAQKPKILFLDEPTTYLDMCHQLELMELVQDINKRFNITIVMVLHDLNQASRYSNRVVIMKEGKIIADGKPEEVIVKDIIHYVYNVKCAISKEPICNRPQIYPLKVSYDNKYSY
ncbi:ABC transporter ATP-binding protein [Clostridium sp.]|uniref:ABC transporter ATP-binding protein n=1 Tax=Clostridium sp. TaxID=1506 RepID=UPI00260464EB|nr:ABC transporter ATP-binding protein [Clostridium sp.]